VEAVRGASAGGWLRRTEWPRAGDAVRRSGGGEVGRRWLRLGQLRLQVT
jgi:hypothetical protein